MKLVRLEGKTLVDLGEGFPLVIVEGELGVPDGKILPREISTLPRLRHGVEGFAFCGEPRPFTTKKGREAILCPCGETHLVVLRYGAGDRDWGNWDAIRPVDPRVWAFAVAASKGGGCWYELWIIPVGIRSYDDYISAEKAECLDELEGV